MSRFLDLASYKASRAIATMTGVEVQPLVERGHRSDHAHPYKGKSSTGVLDLSNASLSNTFVLYFYVVGVQEDICFTITGRTNESTNCHKIAFLLYRLCPEYVTLSHNDAETISGTAVTQPTRKGFLLLWHQKVLTF